MSLAPGTIVINGITYNIFDGNVTSDEIALSTFSGEMGFIGQLGEETIKKYGLNVLYAKRFGRVFDIVDGIISGVFDTNLNPDKELEALIGTQVIERIKRVRSKL